MKLTRSARASDRRGRCSLSECQPARSREQAPSEGNPAVVMDKERPALIVEARKCHIALFDILGFRQLIQAPGKVSVDALGQFVERAHALRTVSGESCAGRVEHRIFQDTLVAYTVDASRDDLRCLLEYSCAVIAFSFVEGMYLRGALTTGDVLVSSYAIIGEAFVRAYEMEQAQDWVGGWMDDRCVDGEPTDLIARYLVVRHPIPLKAGPVRAGWALNWPICITCAPGGVRRLAEAWRTLIPQGDTTWEVRRKLINLNTFLTKAAAGNWQPKGVGKCSHGERIHLGPGWVADYALWASTLPEMGGAAAEHTRRPIKTKAKRRRGR